ncbi:MAG TPA: choice-of-anchor D domain-containing protein, partial [Thermoanaerobaculia bacterium]|nr:choice-of-anchor D domain-containing protein [Thermoanaerobaculia bacterium]
RCADVASTLSLYLGDRAGEERKRRRRGRMAAGILVGVIAAAMAPRPVRNEEKAPQVGVHIGGPLAILTVPAVPLSSTPLPAITPPLPAKAIITPPRLVFSDRNAPAQLAVVRNDGGTDIDRVSLSADPPFAATNGCAEGVAAGAQCVIAVVFAPSKGGRYSGTLKIAAGADRASVSLRGSAIDPPAPPPQLPPARRLCVTPVNIKFTAPGTQTVTLSNSEPAVMRVVSIVATNRSGNAASGYDVDAAGCIRFLAPGQQCSFTISATKLALELRERMGIDITYEDLQTGIRRAVVPSPACSGR